MNKMNLFAVFNAAKAGATVVNCNGVALNPSVHPLMGVVPVKSVQVLGSVLYIGYLAEYNNTTTTENIVVNVYTDELVATGNKNMLYGIDNEYITAIVANGDYNKIVDAVADNNLRIRVVRG